MKFHIFTIFPEMYSSVFKEGVISRGIKKGQLEIILHNIRDYTNDKHKKVDDYPFGGGAGMVMTIEPIDLCLEYLKKTNDYDEIIYLTPDGEQLAQNVSNELSLKKNIIIICGHYKGIDQRVRDHLITREISIGDFVLSGGELAAAVLCDGIIRLIPGVIGDESSALTDSYQDGLLAPPIYTRPAKYKGWSVPEILTSGDTTKVDAWREEKALEKTQRLRPDLLNED